MIPETVSLEEWDSSTRVLELTPRDQGLANLLRHEGKLEVEELRHGTRFASRAWVGVVEFDSCRVTVVPKLADGNLGLVKLLQYTTGLEGLSRLPSHRPIDVSGFDLLDLICALLVDSAERLTRAGILADYVEQEDALPALRGRILADRQMLLRFGRLDTIWCRFDDHISDIWENQLVTVGLMLAAKRARDERTRTRARRLSEFFLDICDPRTLELRSLGKRRAYHRLNRRYLEAHQLTLFLLQGLGIQDVMALGDVRSFAFLVDMNTLFERFVFMLLNQLFTDNDLSVEYQPRDRSIIRDAETQRPYATVIPDVLISSKSSGRRLPVDAKYKRYSQRQIATSDIYQSFLYAYAYGDAAERAGLVLYPSETDSLEDRHLQVTGRASLLGADIGALGLPLPSLLAELTTGEIGPVSTGLRHLIGRHGGDTLSGRMHATA